MAEFWKDEPHVKEELRHVRSFIVSSIERANPFIRDILHQRVASGGKLIRPGLVIIGGRLGDSSHSDEVIRIASVIEMIHLASLVHDDIIDGAKTRRGIPTINALLDPRRAVIAGDFLLSRAMALIQGDAGDLSANAVAGAFSRLCESEIDQDAGQGNFFISESTYLRRIGGKTAALFALSAYAGVAVANGSRKDQFLMHRIGYCLGMAFQIQDDILDFTGDERTLGKDIGQDIYGGIPTYPLIAALRSEADFRRATPLADLLRKDKKLTRREARKAVALSLSYGGVDQAFSLAEIYTTRAMNAIEQLSDPTVAEQLTRLYRRLTDRKK